MRKRPFRVHPFLRGALPVLIVATALTATFGVASADGPWLPPNVSTLGERIDHLYNIIFWLVAILFFGTEIALLWFIIRYRRKKGVKVSTVSHSGTAEAIWSIIPALILIFIAVYQWNTWADAKIRKPDESEAVKVQIIAKQFEWRMRYAGPDGVFATEDDVTTTNQLYIPENKMILAQMRSEDVIHSFFLPEHRVKQDVNPGPGNTVWLWFDAHKTGKYEIACAEICGLGHYRMRAQMFVQTQDEFESWLQGKYDEGKKPADWGWDWEEGI